MHKNHSFPDIQRWISLLEDPERATWQKPEEVVKAPDLKPGNVVADIGSGTGYFTRLFSMAVNPDGKAIGLDMKPAMVDYMKEDAMKRNLDNYLARIVKSDDRGLEPRSINVIFLCNTLHHIENRTAYLRRLSDSLRPGGRIVIIDFFSRPLPVGPPPGMKLEENDVIRDFESAGYRLIKSHNFLPYRYFLEFCLQTDC